MKAESNIGGLLGKASRLLSNNTVEQWTLLATLWTQDHQSQKALQEALLKDKASINSLLNYLIKGGFVIKKQSTQDKRSFIVSLTQKGKEIQAQSIPIAMENIGVAVAGIDPKELEVLTKVLNQIIINLTKEKS